MKVHRAMRKIGTSLGVVIPKLTCEALGVEDGDIVEVEIQLVRKKGANPADPDKVAKEQPEAPKTEEGAELGA